MYPGQTTPDSTDPTPQQLKPQAPQNEEKRTLEGESRTNVPRTDGLRTRRPPWTEAPAKPVRPALR